MKAGSAQLINTLMPPWELPPDITESDIDAAEGFVYRITRLSDGRFYVGKKYTRRRSGRKFVQSNWRDYWGSSEALALDLKTMGHDAFRREIISVHSTRSLTDFAEVEAQFGHRCLTATLSDGSPASYNRTIAGRWFARQFGLDRVVAP